MPQVLFYCPNCAFSKEISQSEIPSTAKQCKCPSCRNLLDISDAIKPLQDTDSTQISPLNNQDLVEEKSVPSPQESTEEVEKTIDKYYELLDEALSTLKANNDLEAMLLLEEAEKLSSTPKVRSYLAYCRAKVKGEFSDAIRVCTQALKEDQNNADHYLNLGRVYMLANKRGPAIQAFRKGLKLGPNPQLMQEVRKFDKRKQAVISSLSRDHILNRSLGRLLSRLGLR